jgi:hypothetical protein
MRLESEGQFSSVANRIMWLTLLCAGLLLAGAVGVVVYQCFVWLSTGEWLPFEVRWLAEHLGLRQALFGPGDVQQIFDGILGWPLSLALFGIGLALGYLGVTVVTILDTRGDRGPLSRSRH